MTPPPRESRKTSPEGGWNTMQGERQDVNSSVAVGKCDHFDCFSSRDAERIDVIKMITSIDCDTSKRTFIHLLRQKKSMWSI